MSESELSGSGIYLQPEVTFEQGCRYLLCARSGHGKSSLLNFIYGTNRSYDGDIVFEGDDIPSQDDPGFRVRVMSYMFQDLCLFPQLTAMENVQLKNRLTGFKSDAEIEEMLGLLLPPDKKSRPLETLSLGQRQRVAVVRALCQPFRFLLLDEPFSHIDRDSAVAVASLVEREVERQGAGLIVTSLDVTDSFHFSRIINL